jgi:hypothetical protein
MITTGAEMVARIIALGLVSIAFSYGTNNNLKECKRYPLGSIVAFSSSLENKCPSTIGKRCRPGRVEHSIFVRKV